MWTQLVLYIATVLGAVGVYLLMPRETRRPMVVGGLLAAAALGGLWLVLATQLIPRGVGFDGGATLFYYVFSSIAICAAVRVITHTRPVYAALWFVMVVIASAGLMLTLAADFMAFAMLIIYGGAILVTYMFVIMLATPPRGPDEADAGPDYDRFAREPLWAVTAGFLLLAVMLSVMFTPIEPNPLAIARLDTDVTARVLTDRAIDGPGEFAMYTTAQRAVLSNPERIGLDLFMAHPLAIELAGVILLVALIGAIVIARARVEGSPPLAATAGER